MRTSTHLLVAPHVISRWSSWNKHAVTLSVADDWKIRVTVGYDVCLQPGTMPGPRPEQTCLLVAAARLLAVPHCGGGDAMGSEDPHHCMYAEEGVHYLSSDSAAKHELGAIFYYVPCTPKRTVQ